MQRKFLLLSVLLLFSMLLGCAEQAGKAIVPFEKGTPPVKYFCLDEKTLIAESLDGSKTTTDCIHGCKDNTCQPVPASFSIK